MLGDYGMIYLNKHKSSRRREEAMDKNPCCMEKYVYVMKKLLQSVK